MPDPSTTIFGVQGWRVLSGLDGHGLLGFQLQLKKHIFDHKPSHFFMLHKIIRTKLSPLWLLLFFFAYFLFWWSYKLGSLPGLHGDEAWSGLKAYRFDGNGITQITGMNNYTGVLEALSSLCTFKILGMGVVQLRSVGIILNLIGLMVLSWQIKKIINSSASVVLLMIIAQSVMYLFLPRVAWEVNTYNLILSAVTFMLFEKIRRRESDSHFLKVIFFLLLNIIGSYNHIVFSCISISALLGIVVWSLYNHSLFYAKLIYLLSINALNIVAVFLSMRYFNQALFHHLIILSITLITILLMEVKVYQIITKIAIPPSLKICISYWVIKLFLAISAAWFLYVHGLAFFNVISGYKILLIGYSYTCPEWAKWIMLIFAAFYCAYLLMFIWLDVRSRNNSLLAIYIICYCGLLTFYTTGTAFRYYLGLYLITACYLAYKISIDLKKQTLFLGMLTVAIICVNLLQIEIFCTKNRMVKAIWFKWSANQIATSAHFLPKEPLLNYLVSHNVTKVKCSVNDDYFINGPLLFYEFAKPRSAGFGNHSISISFDKKNGTGFIIKPNN
ncbi:hypothetical protein [Mucilaginibacter sp. UYCu711]|uniref:hypothetical protein n=1 Tax=Mucilaginibacter sp. UYCu711 TaxID=3156339 RepID=UPI003D2608A8